VSLLSYLLLTLSAAEPQGVNTRSRKAKKIPALHSAVPRATILGVSIFLMAIAWLVFGETLRHPSINFSPRKSRKARIMSATLVFA
jgi:quinol-cytochrome oxidoreductase complex cytochrome b subunit